jgi:hypothetical protein
MRLIAWLRILVVKRDTAAEFADFRARRVLELQILGKVLGLGQAFHLFALNEAIIFEVSHEKDLRTSP